MVDVVDDDEFGLKFLDCLLESAYHTVEVVAEGTELVEAKQRETLVVGVKGGNHLVEEIGTGINAMD